MQAKSMLLVPARQFVGASLKADNHSDYQTLVFVKGNVLEHMAFDVKYTETYRMTLF